MLKIRLAGSGRVLSLILIVLLAGCNLNTSNNPGDNQTSISGAPVVEISGPLPNGTFLENVPVNIVALVSNAGTDIDRVEIVVDGSIIQTLKSPNTAGAASFSIAQSWTAAGVSQHTIGVTAFRADGSSSAPATVTINVILQGQSAATPTVTLSANSGQNTNGGQQSQPTTAPQPTSQPPPPTNPPPPAATATSSAPMATFNQGVNVRSGPSTKFNPPIGSFAAGQTAEITGKTPAGDWFKVKYYNGEGWVFAQLLTASGDQTQIPVDAGPPIPTDTPVPPTAIPATAVPQTQVNLVAGIIVLDPSSAPCFPPGQGSFNIAFDVANLGSQANSAGGTISVVDTFNGQQQAVTTGAFPVIQPGQTVRVGPMPLTVSTNFAAGHHLTLIIDPNNQIAETNEGDNTGNLDYTLSKGGC